MSKRIYNFSAGPATLPLEILEQAQNELLNFQDQGMSIMEMSHRSKTFESVLDEAKSGIKELLAVPDTHEVLFLQGGASLQFSMVAMNLKQVGVPAKLVNTGVWTKKAKKEIAKETQCDVVASSEQDNFMSLPSVNIDSSPASFVYICSNNTIAGTQYHTFPETNNIPLVADMSSDILSRPLDISKFGLIFAGAQKNVGPAGVTIVIIKKDLLERSDSQLPSMLNYNSFVDSNSLYNTIPTFGVYMISLTVKWLEKQGGLDVVEAKNKAKAQLLYDALDESDFYVSPVAKENRSLMNVVFRIKDREDLEKLFVAEAEKKGLSGLKGHRSVGGLRASIYNAHPQEGVEALVEFMKMFELTHKKGIAVTA